jgi:hypothetical protein
VSHLAAVELSIYGEITRRRSLLAAQDVMDARAVDADGSPDESTTVGAKHI